MKFCHFSLTTEMDPLLVPVSFRTFYDFDLNEAIDIYDKCSIVVVKVLNTSIRQSFIL